MIFPSRSQLASKQIRRTGRAEAVTQEGLAATLLPGRQPDQMGQRHSLRPVRPRSCPGPLRNGSLCCISTPMWALPQTRTMALWDPVVNRKERTSHLDWITEHWDRIGQFFAAFASGQTTASVALKRLVGHGPKNRFYRATRELGRVFKTEFILDYLSQPALRTRIRRGLLKGEQLHVGETWRSGLSSTKPNFLRSTSSRPAHFSKQPG